MNKLKFHSNFPGAIELVGYKYDVADHHDGVLVRGYYLNFTQGLLILLRYLGRIYYGRRINDLKIRPSCGWSYLHKKNSIYS